MQLSVKRLCLPCAAARTVIKIIVRSIVDYAERNRSEMQNEIR